MLKLLLAGVWGAAMTGAGIFLGQYVSEAGAAGDSKPKSAELEQVTTEITGAPIIADGRVQGYLVFRVKSSVDVAKLPSAKFEVSPFLIDAAFQASYELYQGGLQTIGPEDVGKLTKMVADKTNARLGADTVKDVEVDQFNFIPADRVRQNIFSPK